MALVSIGNRIVTKDIVDRDDERIMPKGARLKNFEKNPIMLYNHNRWSSKPIGKWANIKITDDAIEMEGFISDATESSKEVLALAQDKVINTQSMGFIPKKWSDDPKDKLPGQKGLTVTDYELIEVSMTDIPSNPEATEKSFGEKGEESPVKVYGSVKSWMDGGKDGIIVKSFVATSEIEDKNFDNMNIFELLNKYFGTSFGEDSKMDEVEASLKKFTDAKGLTASDVQKSFETYDGMFKTFVDEKITEATKGLSDEISALKMQLKEIKQTPPDSPEGDDVENLKDPIDPAEDEEVIDVTKFFTAKSKVNAK
jgi:HK97 family phage prohead protease